MHTIASKNLVSCFLSVLLGCVASLGCAGSAPSPESPSATATPAPVPTKGTLHLGSTQWPPFTDSADRPALALELVNAALARVGYAATTEIVPEGTLTDALKQGKFEGSPAMWPSAERQELLIYSDPYLENRLVLVGAKGSDVSSASLAALVGKRIGIAQGYAYGPEVEQVKGPVLVRGYSDQDNLRALIKGELDYVLVDALVAHHVVEHNPAKAAESLAIGEVALFTRTLHLALRKDVPNAREIIDAFNRQLPAMRGDGAYNEALQVQWVRADVDGDGQTELVASGDHLGTDAPSAGYELLTTSEPVHMHHETEHEEAGARFVVNGVPYDTWDAVPDRFKSLPTDLEDKPRSLRVELFEF